MLHRNPFIVSGLFALLFGCDGIEYVPDELCVVKPILRVQIGDLNLNLPRKYNPGVPEQEWIDLPRNINREICQRDEDSPIRIHTMAHFVFDNVHLPNDDRPFFLESDQRFVIGTGMSAFKGEGPPQSDWYPEGWRIKLFEDEWVWSEDNIRDLPTDGGVPFYEKDSGARYYIKEIEQNTPSYHNYVLWDCHYTDIKKPNGQSCGAKYRWTEYTAIEFSFIKSYFNVADLISIDRQVREFWSELSVEYSVRFSFCLTRCLKGDVWNVVLIYRRAKG